MKKLNMILAALAATVFMAIAFTSCNQDPADADLFAGRYEGTASYASTKDGLNLAVGEKVTIRVFKVGDTYTFRFSSKSIQTLSGVKMKKGENTLVTLDSDAAGLISIDEDKLTIAAYTTSEGSWSATATRVK